MVIKLLIKYRRFKLVKIALLILFNCEIRASAVIPKSTIFHHHARNVTIGDHVVLGENCQIYQDVLLGDKEGHPLIGNNVTIFPKCHIIGNIEIGNNCIIGGNTFLNKSIKDNCTVYNKRELVNKEVEGK